MFPHLPPHSPHRNQIFWLYPPTSMSFIPIFLISIFLIMVYFCLFIYLFILFLAALGLRCWLRAFSRFAKRGLLSGYGAWASRCGGLSCCGAQALGRLGFSSCGTWAYLQHVGSSWTRYQTRVPCTGRQILNHCTPREAPSFLLISPTAPFSLLVAWPVLQGSQSTTSPSITSVDGASRTTAIAGEEKESESSSSQFLPLPF